MTSLSPPSTESRDDKFTTAGTNDALLRPVSAAGAKEIGLRVISYLPQQSLVLVVGTAPPCQGELLSRRWEGEGRMSGRPQVSGHNDSRARGHCHSQTPS